MWAWADRFLPVAVTNITREKLRVGIWSGNIILTDLELRQASATALRHEAPRCREQASGAAMWVPHARCSLVQDALDALHLPVRLVEGRIGRLQIRVPWSRLRSEPIEIECDDLLLRVRLRDEPDAAAHNQREQLRKRMQLDAEELLRGLRADAGLAHPASRAPATADSFLSRIGAMLLDNLRVHLVRLHVRYEHTAGDGGFFACGGTLRRFEMCSRDADGQPQHQPVAARQPWLHKTLALEGASLYWDAAGAGEIATEGTRATVLPPTDASVLLRQCRATGPESSHEPRNSWSCALDPVEVTLTDRQYEGMLQLAADWTCHALRERCDSPPCSPPIFPPSVRLLCPQVLRPSSTIGQDGHVCVVAVVALRQGLRAGRSARATAVAPMGVGPAISRAATRVSGVVARLPAGHVTRSCRQGTPSGVGAAASVAGHPLVSWLSGADRTGSGACALPQPARCSPSSSSASLRIDERAARFQR